MRDVTTSVAVARAAWTCMHRVGSSEGGEFLLTQTSFFVLGLFRFVHDFLPVRVRVLESEFNEQVVFVFGLMGRCVSVVMLMDVGCLCDIRRKRTWSCSWSGPADA
jgi:hypothetical protein